MLYACVEANTTNAKYGLHLVANLPPLTACIDTPGAELAEARRTRNVSPFTNFQSMLLAGGDVLWATRVRTMVADFRVRVD